MKETKRFLNEIAALHTHTKQQTTNSAQQMVIMLLGIKGESKQQQHSNYL